MNCASTVTEKCNRLTDMDGPTKCSLLILQHKEHLKTKLPTQFPSSYSYTNYHFKCLHHKQWSYVTFSTFQFFTTVKCVLSLLPCKTEKKI
jgi:hypothetical protein